MKNILSLVGTMLFTTLSNAQNVNIPDANFKSCLLSDININTNQDSEIQLSEAQAFTGDLTCMGQNITDVTGLEAFTNLTILRLPMNQLTTLNVTQNVALETIICAMNNINVVDVTNCPNLIELVMNDNNIISVDVTQNPVLTRLEFPNNSVNALDVTQNPLLEILDFSGNSVSSIDLTQNTVLNKLILNGNSLDVLNLTQNTALTYVECMVSGIPDLDLSQNVNLEYLRCDFYPSENLDLSNNVNLTTLGVFGCPNLTTLNLANGNNTNMSMQATSNPNLTCVQVDDTSYSQANWATYFDNIDLFSLNCQLSTEEITKETIHFSPNPMSDKLTISNDRKATIQNVKIYNIQGQLIQQTGKSNITNDLTIDVTELPNGIYTIQVELEGGESLVGKVIKE